MAKYEQCMSRKGDEVVVIAGADKGKRGKIIAVLAEEAAGRSWKA